MKIKRYDFSKKPKKPSKLLIKLVRKTIVPVWLDGQKYSLEKINMEGIEPPYLLFCPHSSQIDYPVFYRALAPHTLHVVCSLYGIRDVGEFLLSRLGCFYKRTFVNEITTLRHMRTCIERDKNVMCVFPESRYSFDGTLNSIPASLGKMAKLMKVPVAVLRMNGNYLSLPQWNSVRRHPPIHCEIERIATAEEVLSLSANELQERIAAGLKHDDFAYQLENKIVIEDPKRAEGLHHILYQCPHCKKEFEMSSEGTLLSCNSCKKEWELTKYGQLAAKSGETEFPHIPDWMNWQREQVRQEVRRGDYRFEDEVDVHTLPHYKKFYHHGKGRLVQTNEGFTLECTVYGEKVALSWEAHTQEGIHIEFDYPKHKNKSKDNGFGDCIELSTLEDSFWLSPLHKKNCIMKLSLATEEINKFAVEQRQKR